MAEIKRVVVVCDLCTRTERPATHRITIDVCNRHTIRDSIVEEPHLGVDREQDNEDLLAAVSHVPGQRRSFYAEALEWEIPRLNNAYNRLRKLGLMKATGKAQNSTWVVTRKYERQADAV